MEMGKGKFLFNQWVGVVVVCLTCFSCAPSYAQSDERK